MWNISVPENQWGHAPPSTKDTHMKKIVGFIAVPVLALSLAACGSKPSKEEVLEGLKQQMQSSPALPGISEENLVKISTCVVDKVYDKVSNETLRSLIDGDQSRDVPSEDKTLILEESMECGKELAKNFR